jgi:predicted house-cleaning noncanonical NTP pyrophosphatase (MazG superfamily)
MTKHYHKLVRDKIPQIIEKSGKTCKTRILSREEYCKMLDEKLEEELAEYQESKSLEELADLLEVMAAVVEVRGYTWQELTRIREEKREARGGFREQILLEEVQD